MERTKPEDVMALYAEAQAMRSHHESDWRMAAAYTMPSHYSAWQTDGPASYRNNNAAARRVSFDTTGARSLPKYVSVLERLATPIGQRWHGLMPTNPELRKSQAVRAYFDEMQDLLFKMRYDPAARFRASTNEMYSSMGTYGNGPIYIGQRDISPKNRHTGFKYVGCPFRDVFILVDDDGNVCGVFRRFWLNVRQFQAKFPNEPYPSAMKSEAAKATPGENTYFEFVHYTAVRSNSDYDPEALSAKRHPVVGAYLCVKSKAYVGDETGYQSLPYKVARPATVSGDPYGYSPAVAVLSALGGASTMKKTNLKQGQKAVDPVLLAYDDGVMNGEVDLRPGSVNPGGVNKDGKELIKAMQTGNFRVAEVLLQDERTDIEDSFFVTLFQILNETPEMTATEVMERVAEKAALLSPTMGRLQSEFLGPTIEREIDLLAEMGKLPEAPPELVEAEGEYEIVYTSPLAKGMYAEEVSGFMRSVEMSVQIAEAKQDPTPLDHYDFDTAIPEIADALATPARWMNTEKKIEKIRSDRQKAQEAAQLMDNAPALASVAKTAADMESGSNASR